MQAGSFLVLVLYWWINLKAIFSSQNQVIYRERENANTYDPECVLMQRYQDHRTFVFPHPISHLAEKRLSTNFCDWSEVTEGLLWKTRRQRSRRSIRQAQERERERERSRGHFSQSFRSEYDLINDKTNRWDIKETIFQVSFLCSYNICVCFCLQCLFYCFIS